MVGLAQARQRLGMVTQPLRGVPQLAACPFV